MSDDVTPTCQARTIHGTCGAGPHEVHDGICAKGHTMLGNQLGRKHGAYSFRDRGTASLPPDVRLTVAEFKAAVITDRGGPEELSTIEAARIGHLGDVETVLRLLASDIARRGLMTPTGRVRATHGKWLQTLEVWQRLAAHIGDGRRARQVPTLAAYLAQAQTEAPATAVAGLRAELAAAETELDRADDLGDTGAVVRLRARLEPRIAQLRRAIAEAERDRVEVNQ